MCAAVVLAKPISTPSVVDKVLEGLEGNDEFGRTFQIGASLGEGTQAKVYSVVNRSTHKSYAVKVNKKVTPGHYGVLNSERVMLEALQRYRPLFPQLKGFYTPVPNKGVLVMNVLPMDIYRVFIRAGGRKLLQWNDLLSIGYQLCSMLDFMRANGLVHADMKPENIFFDEKTGVCTLSDFGIARTLQQMLASPLVQSRFYRAIEVFLGLPADHRVDMWSVGCILAELILRKPLFNSKGDDKAGATQLRHLRCIAKQKGLPPEEWSKHNKKAEEYLTALSKEFIRKPPDRLESSLIRALEARYPDVLEPELRSFAKLICEMLDYVPDKRITPKEARRRIVLKLHKFIQVQRDPAWKMDQGYFLRISSAATSQPLLNIDFSKHRYVHHMIDRVDKRGIRVRLVNEVDRVLFNKVVEIPSGSRLVVNEKGVTVIPYFDETADAAKKEEKKGN